MKINNFKQMHILNPTKCSHKFIIDVIFVFPFTTCQFQFLMERHIDLALKNGT